MAPMDSPMDSGDSCATSCVGTNEEEWEMDRQEVDSESSHEDEITKEPMEEEDTELVGSATTDTTLGSVTSSSQEAGCLKTPWISATQVGAPAWQNRPLQVWTLYSNE